MTTAPQQQFKPRPTRVLLQIPLMIKGIDAEGKQFEELGESVLVNKNGAQIRCPRTLRPESDIIVTIAKSGRTSQARVVWSENQPSERGRHRYGIRLLKPGNFWGVYFPPTDWNEPEAWDGVAEDTASSPTKTPAAVGSPTAPAEPPLHTPALALSAPASPTVSARALEVPIRGMEVVVRGISAARIPFQERTILKPVNPREAIVEVRPVVDVGAVLQLIFPEPHRSVKARTTAIGDRRQNDHWKMWVALSETMKLVS